MIIYSFPLVTDTQQFIYRLTKCGELCLGMFCTMVPGSGVEAETFATGRPVETKRRNGAISVLIGHIVAAKTTTPLVTDDSMDYPRDWNSETPTPSRLGHQEGGRTIVLHSVAVLPRFQGRGLGSVLMMAYMQQMNGAGIADRLALIAHDVSIALFLDRCLSPLFSNANSIYSIKYNGTRNLASPTKG